MVSKMNGESLDITAQNIARLKELFPEVLTDGEKIDFDMLKTVLGEVVETEQERYQFTWHGKKKMIEGAQKPSKGTLRPVPDKSKNFDTTENLYIEGDNLEVLKLLQKSYNSKIKMIYIDPPYNTGKDFVYKDNFKDGVQNYLEQTGQVDVDGNLLSTNSESNGRFHTDWLNMMYARLKVARPLLSDDGVIFISIDDAEQDNLKRICNEVFGEKNFVAQLVVIVKPEGRRYGYFAKTHDYILVYAKDIAQLSLNEIMVEGAKYQYFDEKGGFNLKGLRNRNVKAFNSKNRPNLYYPFYVDIEHMDENGLSKVSLDKVIGWTEVYPSTIDGLKSVWRWGKQKAEELNDDLVAYRGNDGEIRVFQIERKLTQTAKTVLKMDEEKGIHCLMENKEVISNKGTKEVKELLNEGIFDFPKPLNLIENLIRIGTNENDIVMDFFSGSGTTAHAVMNINIEDKGKRKFIMVQLPESLDENSEAYKDGYRNICDIGEERIRRAGEKIKEELKEEQQKAGMLDENVVVPDSLDIGFKVLKLDTSNIREWNVDFENLKNELDLYETPFIEGRSELDIVYEIILKQGLEITYPIETFEVNGQTIYDIAFGSLFICLSHKITPDIARALIARRDEHGTETSSVIFSDAGFSNDSDKLNCIEILKDAGYPEDNLLTI
ncbi:site-specific DNA-methyltransferase [Lysinibacillus boronitolerans]|uniref:site-specific DNA-methyltransferase n=1 Tax=Lysinibacillus boronitolerans TaxID=309788 RepID=UPI002161C169|nr:site-specific DNA-methyltransferase [Lysinibacillus boronitolerans]MCS1393264.1 site-specific DNA-methyltransferase [Lysinibacillus boronitolerans]